MSALVFDARACALGEGPLWHPERNQLFWFDILDRKLLTRTDDGQQDWSWDEAVSAAGWIDRDTLFVAGESGFWRFEIATGAREKLLDLEAESPITRSNDGRADPVGGFWIGTMGWNAEEAAGAIYRYFRGEVRKLYQDVTIPNATCFSPDGMWAYFADTGTGILWKQHIDRAGWPSGKAEVFVDFSGVGLNPDGAVCDAQGNVWVAQWGAGRVACHAPDGTFLGEVTCGATRTTCPAFGGPDLDRMFVTSAHDGLDDATRAHQPGAGLTWVAVPGVTGQREHRVVL
ncbi:gluconolactonase [Jannaschia pagri]|uniref:Gluconolactonase n=1 Tax=Jannaschia pagri TaxID=2829797 RepID=A0ABQ4NKQ1_9RHOB|nr:MULTISPECIES: SMP-30/gluconolactonase/LRE family protein [unclassified Jannaschia]GIT91157.1 gluconolactonase [Jannaschia sp. AI_61]GIT94989.1 gluconolactonase [Jannaschia sp. AI_62]